MEKNSKIIVGIKFEACASQQISYKLEVRNIVLSLNKKKKKNYFYKKSVSRVLFNITVFSKTANQTDVIKSFFISKNKLPRDVLQSSL